MSHGKFLLLCIIPTFCFFFVRRWVCFSIQFRCLIWLPHILQPKFIVLFFWFWKCVAVHAPHRPRTNPASTPHLPRHHHHHHVRINFLHSQTPSTASEIYFISGRIICLITWRVLHFIHLENSLIILIASALVLCIWPVSKLFVAKEQVYPSRCTIPFPFVWIFRKTGVYDFNWTTFLRNEKSRNVAKCFWGGGKCSNCSYNVIFVKCSINVNFELRSRRSRRSRNTRKTANEQ